MKIFVQNNTQKKLTVYFPRAHAQTTSHTIMFCRMRFTAEHLYDIRVSCDQKTNKKTSQRQYNYPKAQ